MNKLVHAAFALIITYSCALAADRPARFWNLTGHSIAEVYLAPAGTTNWATTRPRTTKTARSIRMRLRITGVATGIYDAKLKDVSGRSCIVRNIKLQAGEIFSIEERT
jgi:hypothetical protein